MRKQDVRCRRDSFCSGYEPVANSSEYGNEASSTQKGVKFIHCLIVGRPWTAPLTEVHSTTTLRPSHLCHCVLNYVGYETYHPGSKRFGHEINWIQEAHGTLTVVANPLVQSFKLSTVISVTMLILPGFQFRADGLFYRISYNCIPSYSFFMKFCVRNCE